MIPIQFLIDPIRAFVQITVGRPRVPEQCENGRSKVPPVQGRFGTPSMKKGFFSYWNAVVSSDGCNGMPQAIRSVRPLHRFYYQIN